MSHKPTCATEFLQTMSDAFGKKKKRKTSNEKQNKDDAQNRLPPDFELERRPSVHSVTRSKSQKKKCPVAM